jgi:hypothetical protein
MKFVYLAMIIAVVLMLLLSVAFFYYERIENPRVTEALQQDPDGERAGIVMLLTLPSGRSLPVNYLREGGLVFAAADGRWWHEFDGGAAPVSVWIRGEALQGSARAVRDDPEYVADVFSRLRPNAIKGFGTLIEIRLAAEPDSQPD